MEIRLGANIRRLRKEAGLTQEQLAEAMGVTTGAVYKWEAGKASPELEMLVDIAEFFETSVDVLLHYGWQKQGMGETAETLNRLSKEKRLEEGMRYAEKALQKYPNSFDVVLKSAEIFFLTMDPKKMPRTVELYEKALQLIDQNVDDEISAVTIQNRIASCYCCMGRMEEAIKLLKMNNGGKRNNSLIGLILSQMPGRAEEALRYLSDALLACYSQLFNVCVGYANAYGALGKYDEITEPVLLLQQFGQGLRDASAVSWMDREDVPLFLILAEMDLLRGNDEGAYGWLVRARKTALKFDAAPDYRAGTGMKLYHGSDQGVCYDDMGDTAMAIIENHLADEKTGKALRPIWCRILREEKKEEAAK